MADHRIFIYRKANGGAYVDPSPEIVKKDDKIRFWNLTECRAEVKKEGVLSPHKEPIDPGGSVEVTVIYNLTNPGQPEYKEYRVKLTCPRLEGAQRYAEQYAKGGSDPGLIIEP